MNSKPAVAVIREEREESKGNGNNSQPGTTTPVGRLPLMKTFEDAAALAEKESDPFYLAAFMIQCWLGGLALNAAAEYAEKKNPKDRSLHSGQAWRAFLEMFPFTEAKGFRYVLSCLFRFCASDDSPGNSLRRALIPLSIEHHCTGDFFGPKFMRNGTLGPEPCASNQLARRTILRWCEWLDAIVHLQTHHRWHTAPACFDPDPEKRELATLGSAQRQLARLSDRAKACWLCDFTTAAERYKDSPKWAMVGKAMSEEPGRDWSYAEVDTLIITLWPLVARYNWTYRDLLNAIRPALKRPKAYPCEREQDFVTYCANVLGLRKKGRGRTAKNGRPAGYEIAQQLCPGLNRS